MAVRTFQLWAGTTSSSSGSVMAVYTVPPGYTTILKSVLIYPRTTPGAITLHHTPAGQPRITILRYVPVIDQHVLHDLWVVLEQGDVLSVRDTLVATCNVILSGSQLEGVVPAVVGTLPSPPQGTLPELELPESR